MALINHTECNALPWRPAGGVDGPLARLEDLLAVGADGGRSGDGPLPPLSGLCDRLSSSTNSWSL